MKTKKIDLEMEASLLLYKTWAKSIFVASEIRGGCREINKKNSSLHNIETGTQIPGIATRKL